MEDAIDSLKAANGGNWGEHPQFSVSEWQHEVANNETTRQRTTYTTIQEAQADGWRRVNHKADRDVSGGNFFGYEYESPDGQASTTITLTHERNKIGRLGCCVEMFRDSHA